MLCFEELQGVSHSVGEIVILNVGFFRVGFRHYLAIVGVFRLSKRFIGVLDKVGG